ncbi:diaminopimelate epimerase [bacterium AH-315-C07]|nr:diaminopimelate epimerase [bacterium AH-315-C07]
MTLRFCKYQGTGNDFVMVDGREFELALFSPKIIARLCDRHLGIGADGFIVIKEHPEFDFEMVYHNADGNLGSMCGNGGRCSVSFAKEIGIIGEDSETAFLAYDGRHSAQIIDDGIRLGMSDVLDYENTEEFVYLNTGSPHYVKFVDAICSINVFEEGKAIRYSDRFKVDGTNVNFVEKSSDCINVRTYERGVEDETLSCGTGVVASALAAFIKGYSGTKIKVQTNGGMLNVEFAENSGGFNNIFLTGPAEKTFSGSVQV